MTCVEGNHRDIRCRRVCHRVAAIFDQYDIFPLDRYQMLLSMTQSGLLPARFGTKMALVFAVIFETICSTEGTNVLTSTSQNTGLRSSWHKGATVVEKVQAGVITSSPLFKPAIKSARMFALLPLLQKMPNSLPKYRLTSSSKRAVRGPGASQPSLRHSVTASISSWPYASNLFGAYHIVL